MIVGAHGFGGPGHLVLARTYLSLALVVAGLVVVLACVLRRAGDRRQGPRRDMCVLDAGRRLVLVYLALESQLPGSFQVPALNMRAGYEHHREPVHAVDGGLRLL